MDAPDSPRRLARQWTALLLAPSAWAAALVTLFVLTGDACTRDTRTSLWVALTICLALSLTGAALAWRDRVPTENGGRIDRARFMTAVALGLSAMFALVLMLMAVPLLMLGSCRT
jgi:phosphatidylserine synthase